MAKGIAAPGVRRTAYRAFSPKQAFGAVGLGGLVAGKLWLVNKYQQFRHGRDPHRQPAWNNRRSFSRLPRRKQREIIYGKRAQLKDLEQITYGGYQQRGGKRRRHTWVTRNPWGLGG